MEWNRIEHPRYRNSHESRIREALYVKLFTGPDLHICKQIEDYQGDGPRRIPMKKEMLEKILLMDKDAVIKERIQNGLDYIRNLGVKVNDPEF